ncbi:MAG TPA: tetratricopeptide repeat protein [Bacteroidia bacterium]|jgi:Tol biopolymer transport system component/Tfp pilus assembly protein PilF
MKKILYLLVFSLFLTGTMSAQEKQNVFEKGGDLGKMVLAEQKFYAMDYKGALSIYTDVLAGKPNDANVIFHIAECYFELGQMKEARENAEKAKGIDPKANAYNSLLLGKIYQQEGMHEEALAEYAAFKANVGNNKKIEESEVDKRILQVNTAKDLMAKPIDVVVENMGDVINSEFDDKAPMVSADGKTLIFTSRRPGKSSAVNPDDGKYFEDIYICRWDTLKKNWTDAELIPGSINTEGHDAATSISPDGKQIFLFKNDIEAESRGGDIYSSKLSSSGKWGAPKSMGKPINTTYAELGACISPDGKTLYFVSERQGGFGNGDVYMVKRKTRTEWDKPENIGDVVNTADDEGGLFLAPDGKTLFFTSKGHNSMGGYDIFKTVMEGGKWSAPVNLGYPINTIYNDYCFSLSVDAATGYFTSNRKGGLGERDIYKVDLRNYPVLEKEMKKKEVNNGPSMAILKGDIFDASAGSGMEAEILIFDETGAKVGSTTSSEGSGEYFLTLPTGKTYQVKIEVKGYKPVDEKVEIKAAKEGATSVVKHYLLYKK